MEKRKYVYAILALIKAASAHISVNAFNERLDVSLALFFLVNGLLLLNQFSDAEADRGLGGKHFPMIIGRPESSLIHGDPQLIPF